MSKYKDVKVGDKLLYRKVIGLNKWGSLYFSENFFIECEVLRVTKTQFSTKQGRYRKSDGYCIGHAPSIYKAGEKIRGTLGKNEGFVPHRCQKIEASNYDAEMQILRDAQYANLSRVSLTKARNLEDAQEAASLIMRLIELAGK